MNLKFLYNGFSFKPLNCVLEILKIYFYLFIFIYVIYLLLINSFIFGYLSFLILLVGIYYDKRIKEGRYILFIILILFHFIVLNEGWLDKEILIIKDIFWYSLLMLTSFIGHVLILNWLYKGCEYGKGDYGCYVVSRWSILTSLTAVLWIFQWLRMILDYYVTDYIGYIGLFDSKDPQTGEFFNGHRIYHIGNGYDFLKVIVLVFIVIIEYFCLIFQNYSILLLGLNIKRKLGEIPKGFYIFFIFTFLMSLVFLKPRIYIIGLILLVGNISLILKKVLVYLGRNYKDKNYKEYCYKNRFTLMSSLFYSIYTILLEKRESFRFIKKQTEFVNFEDFADAWTDNWNLLYSEGLIGEYIGYSRLPSGHNSEYMRGIYECLYIFEYSPERYKNLIIRMFKSYGLDNNGYTPIEYFINSFKEDFLITDEYLNINDIFKEYMINDEQICGKVIEKGTNSYICRLKRIDGHERGFISLLKKKECIIIY